MKLAYISLKCPVFPLLYYEFGAKNNIGAPCGLLILFFVKLHFFWNHLFNICKSSCFNKNRQICQIEYKKRLLFGDYGAKIILGPHLGYQPQLQGAPCGLLILFLVKLHFFWNHLFNICKSSCFNKNRQICQIEYKKRLLFGDYGAKIILGPNLGYQPQLQGDRLIYVEYCLRTFSTSGM